MKMAEMRRALQSLETVKTSTGDGFTIESAAEALIKLSILRNEIEIVEKAIKSRLPKESLPYEGALGKIILAEQNKYEQNAKKIFDSGIIPKEDFWAACSLKKSAFDKKTEEGRKAVACIEMHETIIGTTETVKVIKNEKIEKDFDFSIGLD